MPAGSANGSRVTGALLSVAGIAATLAFADVARGETVFTYDEAGHLLSVRDSATDPEACGNPPVICPGDPHGDAICADGYCALQCDPGWADAGGRCADMSSDPTACGANLDVCAAPMNGTATCVQGVCGVSCATGYVASGNTCVSLKSDPANCGSLGKRCASVPGYLTCCSASVCGASDGTVCVNVTTDPSNCGWIGHVCAPVGSNPATCAKGRCSKPAGTPRVDRVNGVAPSGRLFRSPFWSGLVLTGANLNLVTWIELEDWGSDTVDGMPDGVQSVPSARQVTLPTGSAGPTIHFQQTATTLTVDAASLEFQGAFDPRFEARHWLKVRIHYTSSGTDRSILADVAVSLTDLVSQGLPPPSIAAIASYAGGWSAGYDPATGLLSYDDLTGTPVLPSSVMSPDLQHEFPVFRVAPEGLYLAKGLSPRQIGTLGWGGSIETLLVFPYDPGVAPPLMVSWVGLIVRGSNLWDDGPLRFTDASGNVLSEIPVALFAGDKIVTSSWWTLDRRSAFVEFASMRGVVRTPWALEFTSTPTLSRIEVGQLSVELENQSGWPQISDMPLPVNRVFTIVGKWLRSIDRAEFVGTDNTFTACAAQITMASEPLTRVDGTPGPNQFRVLDDERIEVRIDAAPATDRAQRGTVTYCDCAYWCWYYEGGTADRRRINFSGESVNHLFPTLEMKPASMVDRRVNEECGTPPPGPPRPPLPVFPLPGGDCTNSICP